MGHKDRGFRVSHDGSVLQLLGAAAFGFFVGWQVYYVNRHRTDAVQGRDLLSLIAAVGGGAVLSLFPAGTDLFGAYGIGLFAGFFGYFGLLVLFVRRTPGFSWAYLLDGRAPQLPPGAVPSPTGGQMEGQDTTVREG